LVSSLRELPRHRAENAVCARLEFPFLDEHHRIIVKAHIGAVLPTKGLPLPLISLGGSNLLVSLMAIGTMLNIAEGGKT